MDLPRRGEGPFERPRNCKQVGKKHRFQEYPAMTKRNKEVTVICLVCRLMTWSTEDGRKHYQYAQTRNGRRK